jgi:hypothetical protein
MLIAVVTHHQICILIHYTLSYCIAFQFIYKIHNTKFLRF